MSAIIRLQALLAAEAEEAVARVWIMLESHRIATPHMTVTRASGITVELSFTSADDAECVAEALRGEILVHVSAS